MKRLLCILPLVVLCGCGSDNTPLQAVVEQYKTDKIKAFPAGSQTTFLVRDTNGAVWYVETEQGGLTTNNNYHYNCIRNTLLFDGIKKVDPIKLEE